MRRGGRTGAVSPSRSRGASRLDPVDPGDRVFESTFNDHQRRIAGERRLLGPDAVSTVVELFRAAGWSVRVADSPWQLDAADRGTRSSEWLEGRIAAAVEERPALRGMGGRVLCAPAPGSSPTARCASSSSIRTSSRGRRDHGRARCGRRTASLSSPRFRAWRPRRRGRRASSCAIVLQAGAAPFVRGLASHLGALGGRGAAAHRGGHDSGRVAVAHPRRSSRTDPDLAAVGVGVLPLAVPQHRPAGRSVGDVHRAVAHGRSVSQVAQASRAVAAERAAGQTVQIVARRGRAGLARDVGLRSRCGHRAARGRRRRVAAVIVAAASEPCARRASDASSRHFGSPSAAVGTVRQGARRIAHRRRRACRDLRRGVPRRRSRCAAPAARRRGADRGARGIHPAQHRRVGTAREARPRGRSRRAGSARRPASPRRRPSGCSR